MDYFSRLLSLLETERKEDRETWRRLTHENPVSERRANGMSWYPIAIKGTEIGRGDYITIEIERTTHTDTVHQFRSGMPASLFSQHDPETDRLDGIITWLSGNTLKLSLSVDELPRWTREGKLGVDLLFDENSYDEMRSALQQASKRLDHREDGTLIRILTKTGEVSPAAPLPPFQFTGLNPAQAAAAQAALEAKELAILHGPPGTGKTITLVALLKAAFSGHLRAGEQVLVVAPSNAAVDLLSERLSVAGLKVVRIGNPARVAEKQLNLTLDYQMSAHPQMKQIKALRRQASEYRNLAHKYKRSFGKAERDQRKALFDEAGKIMKEVMATENYIAGDILERAQVITATLVGAANTTLNNRSFAMVVMDEAGQALEPAAWIPVLKTRKLIMAGDHHQLSPTVKSADAANGGLSETLLQKMAAALPQQVFLLSMQYRMHQLIMEFPSRQFYNGHLVAAPAVATRTLPDDQLPLSFVDTAGCGYEEKREGTGICNPEEADFLMLHLRQLVDQIRSKFPGNQLPDIGIISPYRLQVEILQDKLEEQGPEFYPRSLVTANTIDSFQGQERDIIYISLARSNTEGTIGFLADVRRMNVAVTRAKKKLVIIGDSATLSQYPFYSDFIHFAGESGAHESAWTYLYD
ncbi:AAA domain-containing protein [Flavihumibacter petaseus]|nr:AAA domain-containing protein [Flavihumibacter petaseus]